MTRALLIGKTERAAISAAIERAMLHPVPLELVERAAMPHKDMLTLDDRKAHPELIRPESEHVHLPVGFRASISFEYQPLGLFRHLSVSVDIPGKLPNQPAVEMIAQAFGFRLSGPGTSWLEEFEPGHHAVNIVELVNDA